jgi:hypothetical protein
MLSLLSMIKLGALFALALVACACATPYTDADDVGEAKEAVTTYADPSAVKAAADAGVCIPGAIVVNDVPMHPVLVDGVWTMAEEGDTISRGACIVIKASTILTAEDYEGEYTNCFEGPAGILQLVEVDGVATLDNP